ncbi:MAG TPA: hypothetical protein DHV72_21125 [Serratia grimesii]|uniref:Uncharacterized protein n=1 Tax=Serratia grimesii TaxID=82995 RepID=A0A9C7VA00_9GAMM|nr:hypothetical protein [Serratia grimesii]
MDFELQPGGKGESPQELTPVSDRGERPPLTTPQLEKRRVTAEALPDAACAALFFVPQPYSRQYDY